MDVFSDPQDWADYRLDTPTWIENANAMSTTLFSLMKKFHEYENQLPVMINALFMIDPPDSLYGFVDANTAMTTLHERSLQHFGRRPPNMAGDVGDQAWKQYFNYVLRNINVPMSEASLSVMVETANRILDEYYVPYLLVSEMTDKRTAFGPSIKFAEKYCPLYSQLEAMKAKIPKPKKKQQKKDEKEEEEEELPDLDDLDELGDAGGSTKRSRKLPKGVEVTLSPRDLQEIGRQLNAITSGQSTDKPSLDVVRSVQELKTLIETKVVPALKVAPEQSPTYEVISAENIDLKKKLEELAAVKKELEEKQKEVALYSSLMASVGAMFEEEDEGGLPDSHAKEVKKRLVQPVKASVTQAKTYFAMNRSEIDSFYGPLNLDKIMHPLLEKLFAK